MAESVRLDSLAASFRPLISRSFESCVAEAEDCINAIYRALKLPPRRAPITVPRVSSSLQMVRNRAEVEDVVRDVRAGNWSGLGKAHTWLRKATPLR